jgi:hypothetical protein
MLDFVICGMVDMSVEKPEEGLTLLLRPATAVNCLALLLPLQWLTGIM